MILSTENFKVMTKKTIHIEAIDTLFFRDGKPFSMGDDVWADGIFPPLPSVVYGALRGALMFQKGLSVLDLLEQTKDFKITNLYLLFNDEPAFPFPADLIKIKKAKEINFLEPIGFTNSSSICENVLAVPKALTKGKPVDLFGTSYLLQEDFKKYLKYDLEDVDAFKLSEYTTNEPKTGIGRDNETRTTSGDAEGKMYRVGMQRLEKYDNNNNKQQIKLAVEFENLDLDVENGGFIKLGAEGKTAHFYKGSNCQEINLLDSVKNNESKVIRICLTTPAIFANNQMPKWLENSKSTDGIELKLLAYTLGKPVYVGGFDMQANNGKGYPKMMYKAVPAGSVYYISSERIEDLYNELLALNSLMELDTDEFKNFDKQGFGKFSIGIYPKQSNQ